jgi:hypothetical protein
MANRYVPVSKAPAVWGGTISAWRRWIQNDALGTAVVRFGRLVMLDAEIIDQRLRSTGRLLVESRTTEDGAK